MLKPISAFLVCLGLALLLSTRGIAGPPQERREYIIGPEDLLAITFWQRPELNTDVRVTAAGTIELPLIGTVQAAGLTTAKLRDAIVSRVSLLDIRVTQAAVVVREYASKTVYVTGAVLSPGKKSFEVIPNLWQIILEAGGPQPEARLDEVTIVRGGGAETGKTIRVNLAEALERGEFASLPPVYPGDNINVSGELAKTGGSAAELPAVSISELGEKVHIFGQVLKPGSYDFDQEKPLDLFDALVLAGGPTPEANLKDVRLYFRGRRQAEVASIDMDHYMRRSTPMPLMLHPGDAVYIPQKRALPRPVWEIARVIVTSSISFILFRAL